MKSSSLTIQKKQHHHHHSDNSSADDRNADDFVVLYAIVTYDIISSFSNVETSTSSIKIRIYHSEMNSVPTVPILVNNNNNYYNDYCQQLLKLLRDKINVLVQKDHQQTIKVTENHVEEEQMKFELYIYDESIKNYITIPTSPQQHQDVHRILLKSAGFSSTSLSLSSLSSSSSTTILSQRLPAIKVRIRCCCWYQHHDDDENNNNTQLDRFSLYTKAPLLAIQGRYFEREISRQCSSCPDSNNLIDATSNTTISIRVQNHHLGQNNTVYQLQLGHTNTSSSSTNTGSTGYDIWDGSILLIRYLEANYSNILLQQQKRHTSFRILELGSGCYGTVGLAAAILFAQQPNLSVTLTDLPEMIPHLRYNVDNNIKTIHQACSNNTKNMHPLPDTCSTIITCLQCDWTQPLVSEMKQEKKCYELILIADCVWIESLVVPLFTTLRSILQLQEENQLESVDEKELPDTTKDKTNTLVLIAYQRRGKSTHDLFMQELYQLFRSVEIITSVPNLDYPPNLFYIYSCCRY